MDERSNSRSSGRESAAHRLGSADREERRSGGRSELLMYLTCLPERYRNAKFSLAAYVLCWALLRWYQVRLLFHDENVLRF